MATPGPANTKAPKPPKEKKEITPEQQKMYTMLGVMGVLALITAGIYVPPMLSSRNNAVDLPPPAPETTVTDTTNGAPAPTEPGGGAVPGTTGATTAPAPVPNPALPAPATGASTAVVPIIRHRPDPFEPFYSGVVAPDPTPTPIPPVMIPEPIPEVALPGVRTVSLPGARGGAADSRLLSTLPGVRIPNLNNDRTIPQVQSPFRKNIGAASAATSVDDVPPAYNRRLSGVIFGDGIRALLEINNGEEIITRVVQPGDEVEGITVLSIQRVTEGNRPVTRMVIRENGEERYVDLKAGAPRVAPEGGAPGGP